MTDAYSVEQILNNRIAQTAPLGDSSQRIATTQFVANATRTRLTVARTVFVDNNGSDSNNGSSASSAFKTWQAAYNFVANNLDFNGQAVTIAHASGQTIIDVLLITSAWTGGGTLALDLGGSTWNPTSNTCLTILDAALPGVITVQNGTLETTTSGNCITIEGNGVNLFIGTGITFGACAGAHMVCQVGAHIEMLNNYTISGGAAQHFVVQINGIMAWSGPTVTVTGTPAFSSVFAFAQNGAQAFFFNGANFSGAATGTRYLSQSNAVIFTNSGASATFFPGNAAGSTNNGGLYL